MGTHVCYEFGKFLCKCGCIRRRRGQERRSNSSLGKDHSQIKGHMKPIWMYSGLSFKKSLSPNNRSQVDMHERFSGMKQTSKIGKLRGNQISFSNNLAMKFNNATKPLDKQ
jgi:hypothetical protein